MFRIFLTEKEYAKYIIKINPIAASICLKDSYAFYLSPFSIFSKKSAKKIKKTIKVLKIISYENFHNKFNFNSLDFIFADANS